MVLSSQVWNQASKLQIGRGDFLTFRVQDADTGSCSSWVASYASAAASTGCSQDLDDTAFFARATLDFDRMVPSGAAMHKAKAFRAQTPVRLRR